MMNISGLLVCCLLKPQIWLIIIGGVVPLIVANCVIVVPSLLGGYARFGLTVEQLITKAIDYLNNGESAYVMDPIYAAYGCVYSDTLLEIAVEIMDRVPLELESDYDSIGIISIDGITACLSLQFKD